MMMIVSLSARSALGLVYGPTAQLHRSLGQGGAAPQDMRSGEARRLKACITGGAPLKPETLRNYDMYRHNNHFPGTW